MKAKALSVFRTKLRSGDPGTVLVVGGQIIEGDEDHLRALARNRLVELAEDSTEMSVKDEVPKAAKSKATKAKQKTAESGEGNE